jgi:3-deoxy-D-arabino-heptulosonate 7-phosphate (DAHP) synthase class II
MLSPNILETRIAGQFVEPTDSGLNENDPETVFAWLRGDGDLDLIRF